MENNCDLLEKKKHQIQDECFLSFSSSYHSVVVIRKRSEEVPGVSAQHLVPQGYQNW